MKDWVRKQLAYAHQSIREVMKIISDARIGVAVVVDQENTLLGFVTDSDIRRAILQDVNLNRPISEIMTKNPVTLPEGLSAEECILLMRQHRVNRAPVVDAQNGVKDIALYWKLQESLQEDIVDSTGLVFSPKRQSKTGIKVLVIGAGGYVGSVLCRELLNQGYEVRGVDRFLFGDETLQEIVNHHHFELVKGDIRHLDLLVDAAFGVDAVINLAAIVGDPACDLDVNHSIMINYFSAKAAADAARHFKVDRYLFASTCAVYGASKEGEVLSEGSAVAPVSLYAETKLKTEEGILSLADRNFSPCVFRLSTVYGLSPRMRFDLVVNLFILNALTSGKINVLGGDQWRPYVHVRDVARVFILALRADKTLIHRQVYNLGSTEQNFRVIELAEKISRQIEGTQVISHPDAKDPRNYYVGFDKIREKLGFCAEETIETAIHEIREAFLRGIFPDFKDKKYNNMKQQEHLIFG